MRSSTDCKFCNESQRTTADRKERNVVRCRTLRYSYVALNSVTIHQIVRHSNSLVKGLQWTGTNYSELTKTYTLIYQ